MLGKVNASEFALEERLEEKFLPYVSSHLRRRRCTNSVGAMLRNLARQPEDQDRQWCLRSMRALSDRVAYD